MAGYEKPWSSYAKQLQILQQRGMQVFDTAKALEYLERIGCHRLSGYWHDMRMWQHDAAGKRVVLDQFKPGTQFQDVVALYVFLTNACVCWRWMRWSVARRAARRSVLPAREKGRFAYQDAANFNVTFTQKKKRSGFLPEAST